MPKFDTLYRTEGTCPNPFVFDARVADVFEDMARRSIPDYLQNLDTMVAFAKRYATAGSFCYDLGCSVGELSFRLSQNKILVDRIIAVDQSKAMIEQANHRSQTRKTHIKLEFLQQDIRQLSIRNASVVVLNYVLQFIEPCDRLSVLRNIHNGMRSDGILILSEKTKAAHAEGQALLDAAYVQYKKKNGYEALEISRKRDALETVLKSDTIAQQQSRLKQAGFSHWQIWSQSLHFVSWVVWR